MGLLDQVLGNVLGQRGGGFGAPQQRQDGGFGGGMGGGMGGGGMSPVVMALLSLLATRSMGSRSGGLGGMLGGLLGGGAGGGLGGALGGGMGSGMGGGTGGGGLGGLLGSALGGGGIGGLLNAFERSGHGDVARSWVSHGENQSVQPHQLADALGPETIDQLSQQTGMPRDQMLTELSDVLPGVVDQLTPNGQVPTEEEMQRW